jgi:CO dehydrogenase maturation factor
MGTAKSTGSGCLCQANAILLLRKDDAVAMDMEAGLEHLGRRVAHCVDAVLTVLEPRPSSMPMYENIAELARRLGIRTIMRIGNKIADAGEEEFIRHKVKTSGSRLSVCLPYDVNIIGAEMSETILLEFAPYAPFVKVLDGLRQTLMETCRT